MHEQDEESKSDTFALPTLSDMQPHDAELSDSTSVVQTIDSEVDERRCNTERKHR